MDDKGNKYLPENSLIAIETIKEVLQSQKYLSESAIEEIINAFQMVGKSETENSEKSVKRNPKILKETNIKYIDSDGYLHYKKGRSSRSKWNLRQVISIQTKLNRNYDNVSEKDKRHFENTLGLSRTSVKVILRNLKDGNLEDIVERWKATTGYGIKKKSTPVVNNPERRKEMGFGGIP